MRALGFTHISGHARDLDESARFYNELFGMEEILAPGFPFPVCWLRVGNLQLHLFQSEESAPRGYHFGIVVDGFQAAYEKARELGVIEGSGYFTSPTSTNCRTGGPALLARPGWQHGRGQLTGRLHARPDRDRRYEMVSARAEGEKPVLYLRR